MLFCILWTATGTNISENLIPTETMVLKSNGIWANLSISPAYPNATINVTLWSNNNYRVNGTYTKTSYIANAFTRIQTTADKFNDSYDKYMAAKPTWMDNATYFRKSPMKNKEQNQGKTTIGRFTVNWKSLKYMEQIVSEQATVAFTIDGAKPDLERKATETYINLSVGTKT